MRGRKQEQERRSRLLWVCYIFIIKFSFSNPAFAAPCCGGGGAIPSLITGDDRAQFQSSLSHGTVIGDAPDAGVSVFRDDSDSEQTDIFRMDGAYRLMDPLQVGMGIPIIHRSRSVNSSDVQATGLGDIVLSASYEILPEWSYSVWKPHGFVFLQSTLPTSPSTYDAVDPYQMDARGRGFFTLGLGSALLKTISNWDLSLSAEAHRSFQRTVTTSDGTNLILNPGWGASAMAGVGFSPPDTGLRCGISLSPVWEQGIQVQGDINSTSSYQLVWNTSLQVGYLISADWTASAVYVDQTLMGPARNVSLSRSFVAALQKRWAL